MQEVDLKINTLEVNFKVMFEQNAKEHNDIKDALLQITEKLEVMVDKMDKKYAPMYIRDVVVWGGGIAGSLLIIYALEKIFLK